MKTKQELKDEAWEAFMEVQNVKAWKAYEKRLKEIEAMKTELMVPTEKTISKVYYCSLCDRFTDVRFISDKEGGRPKSVCYKCFREFPLKVCRIEIIGEEK